MTMYHTICVAVSFALLSGCTNSETAGIAAARADGAPGVGNAINLGNLPAVLDIARSYQQLRQMTKEPVDVDPQLAMLCIGIYPEHVEDARKRSGPHAHTSIRIFMNDDAATAFRKQVARYPVGSVIVKEKQGLEYHADATSPWQTAKTSDGVGGMVKRAPGYDRRNGDWEYFYFENPARIEQGRIDTCIECHRGAAASDCVFGSWAEEASGGADSTASR